MSTHQKQNALSGLVVSYYGNSVAVQAEDGRIFQCLLRRNQELPVVGDHVLWQTTTEQAGTILEIKERRSVLARGDQRDQPKLIAANVDVMVVVMAPPPVFAEQLIDRYLVAAELLKISPMIVINKSDLLTASIRQELNDRLTAYAALYPIFFTSVYQQQGLDELSKVWQNKTAVLIGPSGVGKSSMIAALCGNEEVRIGAVSAKGTGKHTTTATRLYHLPQGGCLIDSPGVREFNLWAVSTEEVKQGFKEFSSYAKDCKFRDCEHLVEPNCAVQAAVKHGKIPTQRFLNYQMLMKKAK